MRTLKFYKEIDGRWYIDLPEWTGSKSELEMVGGADTMLEYMAQGNDNVLVTFSEIEFDNADKLEFVRLTTEIDDGAIYKLNKYKGIEMGLDIWLCDVTKFVFNNFPKTIYISVVE